MRLFLAMLVLWRIGASNALAQSEDWLVLPTTTSADVGWMEPTVSKVSRELRRQGVSVWSSVDATTAFEQRGSARPAELDPEVLSAWDAQSRETLLLVAYGEYKEALEKLEQLTAPSEFAIEALNREPERAGRVLDSCLYMVRVLIETGNEDGARAQAQSCVRLVPNTEPTDRQHPPQVIDLYSEAARPGAANRGALLVESEPSDCALRINGVLVGQTPFEMRDLYPGVYRVQVECHSDTPARIHPARVLQGRTALFVFDRFDRALRTAPLLHLQYEELPSEAARVRDLLELTRTLPAGAGVLLSEPSPQELELRLVTGPHKDPGLVRVQTTRAGPSVDAVAKAVLALLSGKCRDLTGKTPVTIDCATGKVPVELQAERNRKRHPPRGQFLSGLTLASVGGASMLAGYGLLIARGAAGDDWISEPRSLGAQDRWVNVGKGLIIAGTAGSATLVAAMPLALPYRERTPWWAWLSGGLGVGLTASAIALAVTADPKPSGSCSRENSLNAESCVDRAAHTDLALMLGVTAAPLLTMPLVFFFRRDDKRLDVDLSLGFQASRTGGSARLRGAF